MKSHFPSNARALALHLLLEGQRHEGFLQERLDRAFQASSLSPADRRLTTQLVYGVLRRQATLDALLKPFIKREPHQVEDWLREALRIGVYQLALLDQIPVHAALNETVELAAQIGMPRGKGFLNGVLRALVPLFTQEKCAAPAADALPVERGQYRRLTRPLLPAPASHPVEYLAAGFSWPHWLAARWLERYSWEECLRLGFWFAGPASLWLRVNPLRTQRDAYLRTLAEAGVVAEPGEHPQAVRLAQARPIRDLPGYDEGWFTVQDESAMRVAAALSPAPGSEILDLCAAPGGKTSHLAELMQNRGRIVACDVDDARLGRVSALCQRLGVSIVECVRLRPELNQEPPRGPFDAVLVDAPCSNTGVLGKRPEVRWRLQTKDLPHLVRLQTGLLMKTGERLKPGGVIVYATCSIEAEESEQVVRTVLRQLPQFQLEAEESAAPGKPADGGYWGASGEEHRS